MSILQLDDLAATCAPVKINSSDPSEISQWLCRIAYIIALY